MRALDIWYDRVTLDDVLAEAPNEEVRTRIMKRIQKAQESSSSEVIFLKLAEFDGEQPRGSKTIPAHIPCRSGRAGRVRSSSSAGDLSQLIADTSRRRFQLCDVAAKVVGVGSVGTPLPRLFVYGR